MKSFQVTDQVLIQLASRPVGAEALMLLREGQLSKRLQLISHVVSNHPDGRRQWEPAVELLSNAQHEATETANDLLTAPYIGVWADRCARRLHGSRQSNLPPEIDVYYLNAVAIAVAVRAGLDASLRLFAQEGMVVLPTLGAARLDAPGLSAVQAVVRQGRLTLATDRQHVEPPEDLSQETERWSPIRSICAEAKGKTISLTVDDLDPYRDCFGKTVATRLSAEAFTRLAALVQSAWELLVGCDLERAEELAAGLRSIVPLSGVGNSGTSATSPAAYGALALTLPERPEHLGATLVHEFQHSKLSALLSLLALYDRRASDRYFAPWRPEPRPFGGLLQGAYAFLAVADYWRRLYEAGHGSASERYFAEYRVQVDNVLTAIQSTPHLTPDGRIFVSHMRDAMTELLAIPVARTVDEAARQKLRMIYQEWQERHARR